MIYTVTFNPAIDYVMQVDELKMGMINRSRHEEVYFGGKGINVSWVLKELGIESVAMGFVAGFTGEALEKGVAEKGIGTDFIHLQQGFTRINVKIKSDSETDLNGQGPLIDETALDKLLTKLNSINDGDTIVLAGSIPDTMPSDTYEKILERLTDREVKTVVDATKDLLLNVLKYRPFLVKPNNYELGEMFGVTLTTYEEIVKYAFKLKELGARNVLVSRAEDGAVLLDENDNTYICVACKGEVKNSVGAGDSMVAGFIAGLQKGDYEYALKLGTAAGGATAFSDGLAQKNHIYKLLEQL